MRLATLDDGTPNGRLAVVSADGARHAVIGCPTLQAALDDWAASAPLLRQAAAMLDDGAGAALEPARCRAPLPRAWQWLDGSAFSSHGALMQRAFDLPPIETRLPLMYQGLSDRFIGPYEDVELPSEADGIDFEGEFGVITDTVPMGTDAQAALALIRLVVQINDWSLRVLAPGEMKTGFGWVQAKPACSMAPFAVAPQALGAAWADGRVHRRLLVDWNGARFGAADAGVMDVGFHELIAHAARTRHLPAGTVIGSGTISNPDHARVGSSCIAERRAIEIIGDGVARTGFMRFGDRVRMEAEGGLFGAIEQQVVKARPLRLSLPARTAIHTQPIGSGGSP